MKTSETFAAIFLSLSIPATLPGLPSLAVAETTEALGDCVVEDGD